jgi:hypothetical protein
VVVKVVVKVAVEKVEDSAVGATGVGMEEVEKEVEKGVEAKGVGRVEAAKVVEAKVVD